MTPVVTRFAPSPTGHLHIGGARTALFCWAFARRHGGKFMIRIEDTDAARSSEESARGILADLAWLGIDNDLGPYRYPRPAEIQFGVFNAALEARWKRAQGGERHVLRFASPHEEIVVRDQVLGDVKIAPGELDDFVIRKADGLPTYHFAVVIDDELMGVTHVLRAQEHLANTPRHVAMQKALTRLDTGAAFRHPVYGHMPLIFNVDGTKMSKRDKAKAARKAAKDAIAKNPALTADVLAERTGLDAALVRAFVAADNDNVDVAEAVARQLGVSLPEIEVWDFRRNGYLPEAITNFVSLLGWNPGMKSADGKDLEKFDNAFLAQNFGIDRIGRTNSKFDRNKLLSFNADCIGAMTDEQFADRWLAWMREHEPALASNLARLPRARQIILARALRPRAKTLRDALRPASFAMVEDAGYTFDPAAVEKNLLANNRAGLTLLTELQPRLVALPEPNWTPEPIAALIDAFAKERALPNPGPIAQPLRVALTGSTVSPGLGETLAVLGKASTRARIARCLDQFRES